MRSFITFVLHIYQGDEIEEDVRGRAGSTRKRDEKCIKSLVGNLKVRYHFEDLGIDGKLISEWVLGKQVGRLWTGFIWLTTGTSDRSF
jgi:hypothetical protein